MKRPAGTLLVAQGEAPAAAWYVREGVVLLSSTSDAGAETTCALRGRGSLLGIEAVRGGPSPCEAWALSDVTLCRVGAEPLRAWAGDYATPAFALLELSLDESMRRHGERAALSGRSLARVARFLLERRRMEGVDRPLPFEKRLLARMLGMRAETLSRVLARMREAGAIGGGRRIAVEDAARLAALAEADPAG